MGAIMGSGKRQSGQSPCFLEPLEARALLSVPAAPSNLSATAVSDSRINLAWNDNATNEVMFLIERRDAADAPWMLAAVVDANVVSHADTGLTQGTHYSYRVRASNVDGDSAYSNEAAANTFGLDNVPFHGTPFAVGYTIQAEDFDTGGQGIAYSDLTPGNAGSKYRTSEGVDIETSTDSGGGYNVGWTAAGEWLEYTVEVATAGMHRVAFRVASPTAGGTFHAEIDGVSVGGAMTMPATGGWQTYQTVRTADFSVAAGRHILRLKFDGNNATGFVGNFNWLKLSLVTSTAQTPFLGSAFTVGQVIRASDFDNGGEGVAYHDAEPQNMGGLYRAAEGVDIQLVAGKTDRYNVAYTQAGEWLEYTVNVPAAGTYKLEARVASPATGGALHVEFGGVNKTGAMAIPKTGGWQTWQTISSTVSLSAGTQIMRVAFDTNSAANYAGNLQWLRLKSLPAPITVQVEDFLTGGEGVGYHDTESANLGGKYRTSEGVDIETTADVGAGYNVGYVKAGEWLKYSTTVAATGTCSIDFRVASPATGGTFHLEVDGANVTGTIGVPNTGGWQTWQTITKSGISLTAGQHTLRLVFDGAGASGLVANFNWITIRPA
jgi:hypothetical protein